MSLKSTSDRCSWSAVVLMASPLPTLVRWYQLDGLLYFKKSWGNKMSCSECWALLLLPLSEQACFGCWVPPARQQNWNKGNNFSPKLFFSKHWQFLQVAKPGNLYFLIVLWISHFPIYWLETFSLLVKMCTMLNAIKFAPICIKPIQHIAFSNDRGVHFCVVNLSPSHPVFHADELSWMPCHIMQPVKWLLGSTGYPFSHAFYGIGMVVAANIWFCSCHGILSCLSPWGLLLLSGVICRQPDTACKPTALRNFCLFTLWNFGWESSAFINIFL